MGIEQEDKGAPIGMDIGEAWWKAAPTKPEGEQDFDGPEME
jgi:hypothetical protein